MTDAPTEGVPGSERVVIAKLPGCERPQGFWISRFMLGVAVGGAQVNDWFAAQPALKKKFFGKRDALVETVQRSRRTTPRAGACAASATWQLSPDELSSRACSAPLTAIPADHLFDDGKKLAQVVRLAAADEGAKDRCRPRLSSLLADDKGVPRLAVHADYGGVMTVEVFGDRCQLLTFEFDKAAQAFVPKVGLRANCPKKSP